MFHLSIKKTGYKSPLRRLALAIVLLLYGLSGCAQGTPPGAASLPRIIGGEPVADSDPVAKSTVELQNPMGQIFCSGVLVKDTLVVTAAHCLADYPFRKVFVVFFPAPVDEPPPPEGMRVARNFKLHDDYNPGALRSWREAANDIAWLRLDEGAPAGFQPVPLVDGKDALHIGDNLLLAGYGRDAVMGGSKGVLRKVKTTLTVLAVDGREFTSGGYPGRSACNGDSGGPAFVEREGSLLLAGLSSRGDIPCNERGIYTDIRAFTSWLPDAPPALGSQL